MTKNKWKRRLLIFFGTLCALTLITEITLRIRYKEQLGNRVYPLIYQPDTLLGFTYIPNTQAEISQPGIHKKFSINENGFYGPSFSKAKPAGKFRIAIIGASEASGIWLNGFENFCIKFQQLLDKQHINAEVLNFSMDGQMRDLNNVRLINSRIIEYSPDMVLLNVNIPFVESAYRRSTYKGYVIIYNGNNPESEQWCKNKIDYIEGHTILTTLYKASYIVRAACRHYMYHYSSIYALNLTAYVEKRLQSPDIRMLPYSVKRTITTLKETEQKLNDIHCGLVVYYYNDDAQYKSILDKNGFKSLFLNIPKDKSMHHDLDGHYNEKAQGVIAQQLMQNYTSLQQMSVTDTTTVKN